MDINIFFEVMTSVVSNLQIWHIIMKPSVSWHTGHLVLFLLGPWLILYNIIICVLCGGPVSEL
jgi:hypothetical protein